MPNYQAISLDRHAGKRWQRQSDYTLAASEAVVALTVAELSTAVMSLPIAFVEREGAFVPVAVLGVQSGKNLFVTGDGRWAGSYIPAAFRSYPFRLAQIESGQQVLCIDEDSGLISDGPDGEPFFNEDGQPAQSTLDILGFVNQIEQNRALTTTACAALQRHHLFRPWVITLHTENGEKQITGLFQINQELLNGLSDEGLLELRRAGALPVAYCQMLSMQHLPMLERLTEVHARAAV